MKVAVFSYSDQGCRLATRIAKMFSDCTCYAAERFTNSHSVVGVTSTCKKVQEIFAQVDLLIFVGACGIAVRAIAPKIKNKLIDPAVLVVDDCGNHVISLLSGHIGGANEFAHLVATYINATPIITTATDINNKFAVDSFAVKNGLVISSMKSAMHIAATILSESVPISFEDGTRYEGVMPDSLFGSSSYASLGIRVGYKQLSPFERTLFLIPKMIHVGIGCKKGTSMATIEKLLLSTFGANRIDIRSIKSFASVDLKKHEEGLLSLGKKYSVPLHFYTANQLAELPGQYTQSTFVKNITGVDNVCERSAVQSALLSSGSLGRLIVPKTCGDGVTIALAIQEVTVNFNQ